MARIGTAVARIGSLDVDELAIEYSKHLRPNGGSSSVDHDNVNLLLLGASDVGKSTLRRQMVRNFGLRDEHVRSAHTPSPHRVSPRHQDPVTLARQARLLDAGIIRGQLFTLLVDVPAGMRRLSIAYEKTGTPEAMAKLFKDQGHVNDVMGWREYAHSYVDATCDAGVREALQRSELQLGEHATYFVEHAMRIFAPGYQPADADLLRLAVRTTGVALEELKILDTLCVVRDVGGMRSERKKWPTQTRDAHAVFFVASLTEFSQALCEDASQNRMGESLKLLREAVATEPLHSATFFLFLTKEDLLTTMLSDGRKAELWLRLKQQLGDGASDDGDVRAAASLIQERFSKECPRCAQVHVLDAANEEAARRALEQSLMLVLSEHAARNGAKPPSSVHGVKGEPSPLAPIQTMGAARA